MDDKPDVPETKPSTTLPKKKSKKSRILAILLIILLIGTSGALGWFYYDATREVRDQKDTISQLRQQLRDLGIEPDDAEPDEATANCAGGSEYSAEVGKFQLTLSSPNVIIRNIDGGFEGGPITELDVGRCLEGETNVVDKFPTREVKITGHPSSDATTLRSNFESRFGSPLTAGPTVTIDGVTAQTYTGEGLFSTKLVYFDQDGIGYQIEQTDTNTESEAILTDVISNWNFTE